MPDQPPQPPSYPPPPPPGWQRPYPPQPEAHQLNIGFAAAARVCVILTLFAVFASSGIGMLLALAGIVCAVVALHLVHKGRGAGRGLEPAGVGLGRMGACAQSSTQTARTAEHLPCGWGTSGRWETSMALPGHVDDSASCRYNALPAEKRES
jgi:hypothetical protein